MPVPIMAIFIGRSPGRSAADPEWGDAVEAPLVVQVVLVMMGYIEAIAHVAQAGLNIVAERRGAGL